MSRRLISNGDSWYLHTYREDKDKCKSLLYGSWDKKKRLWSIIPSINSYNEIANAFPGTEFDSNVERFVVNTKANYEKLDKIKIGEIDTEHDYGKTKPFDHQRKSFSFMYNLANSAIFADPGVGKTYVMINLIKARMKDKVVKKTLVVCPLSVTDAAWANDIYKFSGLKSVILWDKNSKRRLERFEEEADIYIINFEGVVRFLKQLKAMKFDMICVDESSKMKSNKTKISKNLIDLGSKVKYKVIASGTPAPNSPLELWAQFMFLDGGKTLGNNYYKFRNKFGTQYGFGGFQWSVSIDNTEKINELIYKKAIRFKKDDCLDLPEKTFINRYVYMNEEQTDTYNELAETMTTEYKDVEITAEIAATLSIKFQQITSGFVKGSDTEEVDFEKNPKMEELHNLIEEINPNENKIIIWAHFKHDIKKILEEFKHLNPVDVYGETKDRDSNIKAFQNNPSVRLFVAHPAAAGHGLTLVESNYAIYYSLNFSLENYLQSMDRIHRIGQNKNVTYYHLLCKETVDESILKTLNRKGNKMETLLKFNIDDLLRGRINA